MPSTDDKIGEQAEGFRCLVL